MATDETTPIFKPKLSSLSATYTQESDSCDESDLGQELEIFMEDAGGGQYFIIKTDRWAFDNIEDMMTVLKDFKRRLDE